ncbi:hypothetical protein ACP70R_013207 [Stipagrostis hirtigluma subsp. patula]
MAARRSCIRRRRRRLRAEAASSPSSSPPPSSSSRIANGEKPDPRRRTRDAAALRPMLLGLIRGHYLDAISRLPTAELSTTLARGLLVGGHCYGPLHPVHNIIINSADLFQAAAKEARHPEPAAIALFATSVLPSHAVSLLAGKRSLSSPDILRLSDMLLPDELPSPVPSPSHKPNPTVIRVINEKRGVMKIMYQTLLDIADVALHKFARQTGAHYHLHTIYEHSILLVGPTYLNRYFHINFMAWPKKNSSSSATKSQAPVRFFAEAHNPPLENCAEEEITLCYMLVHVDSCYAFVTNNRKLDHPNAEEHCGGRPYKVDGRGEDCDCARPVDVDYRFFDPDRDTELTKYYADSIAHWEAVCPKYRIAKDDSQDDDISDEDSSDEDVSFYCNAGDISDAFREKE